VAERVRDPLHATALVLKQADRAAVLFSLDLTVVDAETTAAIRKGVQAETGIDAASVMVHPIQTHSAPCTQTIWGWGVRNDEYVFGQVVPAAIAAAAEACRSPVPVRVGYGVVSSDAGVNRRGLSADGTIDGKQYPIGRHDPHMTVVRLEAAAGTLATLVHYGAHPTVFGSWSRAVSRDWPGILIDRVEELTGAPALFFGGATGDVAPRTNSLGATGDRSEAALWETGARAAMDAMAGWRSIKDFRDVPLYTLSTVLDLPYRPLPTREEALRRLSEHEAVKDRWGSGMCEYKHWEAVLAALAGPQESAYHYLLGITALGPLAFVPVPGEIFADTSLRLRQLSPFQHTLAASLTGDCLGYLPTRECYARGGYEPWVAKAFGAHLLAEGVDDVLVTELLRHLGALHARTLPPLPAA
jgi:hypothetical protein